MKKSAHYFTSVYDIVMLIPEGRVTTYGAIANYLGLGSARMVGWALHQVASSDRSVPAHRVINRKGELSGASHFDPDYPMQQRLEDEGLTIEGNKLKDFDIYFWDPSDLRL